MTWPMRTVSMYMAPFRLKHAAEGWVEPSYGAELTPDILSLPAGPLGGQVPGSITRWMAIPWQTTRLAAAPATRKHTIRTCRRSGPHVCTKSFSRKTTRSSSAIATATRTCSTRMARCSRRPEYQRVGLLGRLGMSTTNAPLSARETRLGPGPVPQYVVWNRYENSISTTPWPLARATRRPPL